jgi:hypothetical protein
MMGIKILLCTNLVTYLRVACNKYFYVCVVKQTEVSATFVITCCGLFPVYTLYVHVLSYAMHMT